jgi:hypothetical protein
VADSEEDWATGQFRANESLRDDFEFLDNAMMSVPAGWIPIVRDLCENIEETGGDLRVQQIKEKFGSIRFYYTVPTEDENTSREDIGELVKTARFQAKQTCQRCGEPGEDRTVNHWITVLCNDCYKDSTANE